MALLGCPKGVLPQGSVAADQFFLPDQKRVFAQRLGVRGGGCAYQERKNEVSDNNRETSCIV